MPDGYFAADRTVDRTRRDDEPDSQLHVDAAVLWRHEPTIERLWAHARRVAIAIGLAAIVSAAALFAIGCIDAPFDTRGFGDHQRYFLLRFWYLFLVFIVAASPVTLTIIRRGRASAIELVRARGYWKMLVGAFVALPVAIAVAIFVAANLVMILLAIVVSIALFVLLAHLGAF